MGVHILQKGIIDQLRTASSLRYSELQPRDIESSHFKYHLDQLVKDGIVESPERGRYQLTDKGLTFVDSLSKDRIHPHEMPKLITYTLIEDDEQYYLYRKDKEPYRNLLNMIGGKVHLGETMDDASIREVQEKIDRPSADHRLRGIANIRITKDGRLLSQAVAWIYSARLAESSADLVAVKKADVSLRDDIAPDLLPLLEKFKTTPDPFVADIDVCM